MKEDLMNYLMTVKIEGPVIEEFNNVATAIGLRKSKRERRIFKKI